MFLELVFVFTGVERSRKLDIQLDCLGIQWHSPRQEDAWRTALSIGRGQTLVWLSAYRDDGRTKVCD